MLKDRKKDHVSQDTQNQPGQHNKTPSNPSATKKKKKKKKKEKEKRKETKKSKLNPSKQKEVSKN
jgi:hypothetical protein